jgi:hypothetical protein
VLKDTLDKVKRDSLDPWLPNRPPLTIYNSAFLPPGAIYLNKEAMTSRVCPFDTDGDGDCPKCAGKDVRCSAPKDSVYLNADSLRHSITPKPEVDPFTRPDHAKSALPDTAGEPWPWVLEKDPIPNK